MMIRLLKTTLLAIFMGSLVFCAESQADTHKAEILTYMDTIAKIAPIGNKAESIYRKCLFLKYREKTLSDDNFKMIIRDKIIPTYDDFISRYEALQSEIKTEELKSVHKFYTLAAKDAAGAFPLMIQSFEAENANSRDSIVSHINKSLQESALNFQKWGTLFSQLAAKNEVIDDDKNWYRDTLIDDSG